jgi:hypothetical protein
VGTGEASRADTINLSSEGAVLIEVWKWEENVYHEVGGLTLENYILMLLKR